MLRVRPAHQAQAIGRPQQAVDGGIAQFPGARGLDRLVGWADTQHLDDDEALDESTA